MRCNVCQAICQESWVAHKTWACLFAVVFLLGGVSVANGQSEESRFDTDDEKKREFLLEIREGRDYEKSAFSFRSESQDVDVHRNNVDLVFNNCGHLHFNPVVGMETRVADLGEEELDVEVDLDDEDRDWATQSFVAEEGHVYLQVIKYRDQSMTVKFRVDEVERDKLAISWEVLKEYSGGRPSSGRAGTMGKCGGGHPAR